MLAYAASCPPPNLNSAELFSLQTILTEHRQLLIHPLHKHTQNEMAHEYKYDVSMSCSGEYAKKEIEAKATLLHRSTLRGSDHHGLNHDTTHETDQGGNEAT